MLKVSALDWLPHPTDLSLLDKTNTSLEVSWIAPIILETGHRAIINQHLVGLFEKMRRIDFYDSSFELRNFETLKISERET